MPEILDSLVSQLMAKGKSKAEAYAIATSALQKAGRLSKATPKRKKKGVVKK
jgi:ribosomal protein S7